MKTIKKITTLSILALIVSIPSLTFADSLVFPMTIWGDLKSGTQNVMSGSTISFKDSNGNVLSTLVTNVDGKYGGDTAFDKNVTIQEFTGSLSITVLTNSKTYNLTSANLTKVTTACSDANNIIFQSNKCRYDINLNDENVNNTTSATSGSLVITVNTNTGGGGGGGGGSYGGGGGGGAPIPSGNSTSNNSIFNNVKSNLKVKKLIKQNLVTSSNLDLSGLSFIERWNNKIYLLNSSKNKVILNSIDGNIKVTLDGFTRIIATKDWDRIINSPVLIKELKENELNYIRFTVGNNNKKTVMAMNKKATVEIKVDINKFKEGTKFKIYENINGKLRKKGVVIVKNGKVSFNISNLRRIMLKRI